MIPDYFKAKEELKSLVNAQLQKLQSIFSFDYPRLGSNPSESEIQIVGDKFDKFFQAFLPKITEFAGEIVTSDECWDIIVPFFWEHGLFDPCPYFKGKKPFPHHLLLVSDKYGKATKEICNIFSEEIERVNADVPHFNTSSSPLIIANSWTAVVMNEVNLARDRADYERRHAKRIQWEVKVLQTEYRFIEKYRKLVSDVIKEEEEILYSAFNEQSIHLEGSIASEPLWQNFLQNPSDLDAYSTLIIGLKFVEGIKEVNAALAVDISTLYSQCVEIITKRVSDSSDICSGIKEQAHAIQNCEEVFGISQKSIIQHICRNISENCGTQLLNLCERFESSIANSNITPSQIVERIISKKDFCYLVEQGNLEMLTSLSRKLNQANGTPESIYDALVEDVRQRLEQLESILKERDAYVKSYKEKQEQLNIKLSKTAFFRFAQKEELRAELERIRAEYCRVFNEYNEKWLAYFK